MYICSRFSVRQPPLHGTPLPHGSASWSASSRMSSFLTPQNRHPLNCHQVSLRVQVPNGRILTRNLYLKYYFPISKYLIIGYLDLQVFAPPSWPPQKVPTVTGIGVVVIAVRETVIAFEGPHCCRISKVVTGISLVLILCINFLCKPQLSVNLLDEIYWNCYKLSVHCKSIKYRPSTKLMYITRPRPETTGVVEVTSYTR